MTWSKYLRIVALVLGAMLFAFIYFVLGVDDLDKGALALLIMICLTATLAPMEGLILLLKYVIAKKRSSKTSRMASKEKLNDEE